MALQLEGTVKQVNPLETGEGKSGTWKKRGFVLAFKDGNYDKSVYIEGMSDKADQIGHLVIGQQIRVYWNVESREYNGKFYTNLSMWKYEQIGATQATPTATEVAKSAQSADDTNDLPF